MKTASPRVHHNEVDKLEREIGGLVGERCWHARLGYGDELKLDIGRKVPYKSPKLKGLLRGTWTVGSRATPWKLTCASGVVSSRSKRSKIEAALGEVVGNVQAVTVGSRRMSLTIKIGSQFTLTIENRSVAATDDLPYWEVFTPQRTCIQAGPGRNWVHLK